MHAILFAVKVALRGLCQLLMLCMSSSGLFHFSQGTSAEEIMTWMKDHAAAARTSEEFVHYVTAEVLRSKLGDGQVTTNK